MVWYDKDFDADEAIGQLFATYEGIQPQNSVVTEMFEESTALYIGNRHAYGEFRTSNLRGHTYPTEPTSYNLVRSAVDTMVSKIGSQKAYLSFLTEGADFALRDQIKKVEQYVYGAMRSVNAYPIARSIFRDACLYGTGIGFLTREGEQLKFERVPPWELHIDEEDGAYGMPRQWIRSKRYPKESLLALHPEHRLDIEDAATTKRSIDPFSSGSTYNTSTEYVEVVEGYFLPTSSTSGDGRHIYGIKGKAFWDETYDNVAPPFLVIRWVERPIGFWGIGIAEILKGKQEEVNRVSLSIQRAVRNGSTPRLFVPVGSRVKKDMISNAETQIPVLSYTGNRSPHLDVPQTIHPELFRYIAQLKEDAYKEVGISEMSATSRKDKGVYSGVAIQTTLDIETERFLNVSLSWQELFVDMAGAIVYQSKKLDEETEGNYSVEFRGEDYFQRINWKDLNLEEDKYVIQVHSSSLLPQKPAGKLERVIKLMEGGVVGPDEGRRLLDMPDLKQWNKIRDAKKNLVEKTVDQILSTGEYVPLEEYADIPYAYEYGGNMLALAKLEETATSEALDALEQFVLEAKRILEERQAAQQQAAPPQGEQQ